MERLEYYNVDNFNYKIISEAPIQKRPKGNQGKRDTSRKYKNLFCAFDIEASNDLVLMQAFMYIWQFQIDNYTIIGRTWDEFELFIARVSTELGPDEYIMVYAHNLSYEFSFIKGVFNFEPEDVFCIDSRKVLKAELFNCIEFRCSYLLTNMSLATFTERMGVTRKLSGSDFNYKIMRYPWTELTDEELAYCIIDVVALVEALRVYFSIESDNFYTIPFTSTGFVRRDVKKAMRRFNKKDLADMLPDYELYNLMTLAFRGGDTHANRFYADEIVKNVSSFDRVSSYPDVQINNLFPMGAWIHEPEATFDRVIRKIYKQKRAGIMSIRFYNIRLKNPMNGAPYIAKHKCQSIGPHDNDNGRILYAEWLETVVTDIDFKIILDEYDYDEVTILDFYHARYGRLPKPLRDTIIKYFDDKTKLKGVKGSELYYNLQKAKLNSIYGLTVQRVIRDEIKYIDDEFIIEPVNGREVLEKHNRRTFLAYQWGVWTTAHARAELRKAINLVGPERFVYCDTDSVKFIDDNTVSFEAYNNERTILSEKNGGVATDNKGKKYYLGLYEYEGTYKEFVTMGAKKYCYTDASGKLYITVAGVGKSKGAEELAKRGGIEAFKEGFIFYEAGGTESVYNDRPEVKKISVDGNDLFLTSNVLIRDSTYTLGVTGEYRKIINNPTIWLDLFK